MAAEALEEDEDLGDEGGGRVFVGRLGMRGRYTGKNSEGNRFIVDEDL